MDSSLRIAIFGTSAYIDCWNIFKIDKVMVDSMFNSHIIGPVNTLIGGAYSTVIRK